MIALDKRGAGRSPPPPGRSTLQQHKIKCSPQPRNTTGAARNARGLYEVALLNSADPTHAPPPGLPRLLYEQALLERASQVPVDREQEWLAMAARNARVLYEVALLRSANPTHALMGDPPPG